MGCVLVIKVGVLVELENIRENLERARGHGFECAQICSWDIDSFTNELAQQVKSAIRDTGVAVKTFWCGWPGPTVWNLTEGPLTLGLVPEAYRQKRTEVLLKGVEFAYKCGIYQIATHAGFIPEDPNDRLYSGTLVALKQIVRACRANDMFFLFETGQETPTTLLRTIEDLGGDNVGINFDTGNLIMYGKGNPVDALDVFGQYVRDFHCKDGMYPTNGRQRGVEKPLGEGKTDWPLLIRKLKQLGYDGPLTIEREISGPRQTEDILKAKKLLEGLLAE